MYAQKPFNRAVSAKTITHAIQYYKGSLTMHRKLRGNSSFTREFDTVMSIDATTCNNPKIELRSANIMYYRCTDVDRKAITERTSQVQLAEVKAQIKTCQYKITVLS